MHADTGDGALPPRADPPRRSFRLRRRRFRVGKFPASGHRLFGKASQAVVQPLPSCQSHPANLACNSRRVKKRKGCSRPVSRRQLSTTSTVSSSALSSTARTQRSTSARARSRALPSLVASGQNSTSYRRPHEASAHISCGAAGGGGQPCFSTRPRTRRRRYASLRIATMPSTKQEQGGTGGKVRSAIGALKRLPLIRRTTPADRPPSVAGRRRSGPESASEEEAGPQPASPAAVSTQEDGVAAPTNPTPRDWNAPPSPAASVRSSRAPKHKLNSSSPASELPKS
jgi:hypothetical protein